MTTTTTTALARAAFTLYAARDPAKAADLRANYLRAVERGDAPTAAACRATIEAVWAVNRFRNSAARALWAAVAARPGARVAPWMERVQRECLAGVDTAGPALAAPGPGGVTGARSVPHRWRLRFADGAQLVVASGVGEVLANLNFLAHYPRYWQYARQLEGDAADEDEEYELLLYAVRVVRGCAAQ
jgi:hypothetical protein